MTAKDDARKKWKALESNPEVLTAFGRKLGLKEVIYLFFNLFCFYSLTYLILLFIQGWCFNDIFGVDPDLLAMVPQPCVAVILLFPSTLKVFPTFFLMIIFVFMFYIQTSTPASDKKDLFYLTQIPELGNACGNIATLHALGNNRDTLGFGE